MNKKTFDVTQELGEAPIVLDGEEVLRQLQGIEHQDANEEFVWKKKSIFFNLPYWKDNLLRHNLDVMYIEKNVCDNIFGTLLDIKGKTKDNFEARQDLQKMGLRPELDPYANDKGKTFIPPACFAMSSADKYSFLKVIKDVRVLDGYASNVSRYVKFKERIIVGLKSHDSHMLMQ
jgi:hypothetical protein